MPITTPHGFVKPGGYNEVPDGPGAIGALADSVETFATNEVDPLWANRSDQKTLVTTATPTSTTDINLTDLNMSATVLSTADVVWVEIDAEVLINTAGTINVIELLVDGVADPKLCRNSIVGATGRISAHKGWRLTGLPAGAHTLAFRTRNTAGSTSSSVGGGFTSANYKVDVH